MSRLRMSHRSILPLSRYTRKISDDDIVSTYQSQGGCGVVDGFKVSTVSHERNGVVARNNQPILPLKLINGSCLYGGVDRSLFRGRMTYRDVERGCFN